MWSSLAHGAGAPLTGAGCGRLPRQRLGGGRGGRPPCRGRAASSGTGAAALLDLATGLGAAAVALDVPIGLPAVGTRACDVAARARLRGGGASSVFAAPTRGVLAHLTYPAARAAQPSLSAQAFGLVERIRDVDEVLRAAGPGVHDLVVECHPEVSLRALTGVVLPRKKSAPGALLRLRALEAALGPVPADAPPGAGVDDALDALACAWTAVRGWPGRRTCWAASSTPPGCRCGSSSRRSPCPGGVASSPGATARATRSGCRSRSATRAAGPPTQRQSSSQSVETRKDRSCGKTSSGRALCHGVTSRERRAVRACSGPPSSRTYGQPA